MSDNSPSVPKVQRRKAASDRPPAVVPVKLKFPSRYHYRFPAPDDEPFDSVNQVEFAAQYFACFLALVIVLAALAAFVLVPIVGQVFAS